MNLQAESSPPGANGLLFLPYLLGERSPRWNPKARGGFIGLTMKHNRADMIRAGLEGITLNLRVILEVFQEQGAQVEAMRVIGGGARGRAWRQIMADIYGMPILWPALLEEATSMGQPWQAVSALGSSPISAWPSGWQASWTRSSRTRSSGRCTTGCMGPSTGHIRHLSRCSMSWRSFERE